MVQVRATYDLVAGTGTRSFNGGAGIPTQAGDYIVVSITPENATVATNWPVTSSGLTFTATDSGASGVNNPRAIISRAPDVAGGSRVVTVTPNTGLQWRASCAVVFATLGPGGAGATDVAQTVSITRTGVSSMVFMAVCDWNAGAVGSPVWTPGGTTIVSEQQAANATYIFGRWDNSGSTGTAAHGISSPAYVKPASVALEMLNDPNYSVAAPWAPTQPLPGPGLDMRYWDSGALSFETFTHSSREDTGTNDAPAGLKTGTGVGREATSTSDRPGSGTKVTAATTAEQTSTLDRPSGGKISARSSVDSTGTADRSVSFKVGVTSTIESNPVADRPAGSKLAARPMVDSTSVTDRSAGLRIAIAGTTDPVGVSDRATGQKSGSGLLRTSVVAADRTIGTRRAIGASADAAIAQAVLTSFKRATGATRTSAVVLDRATRGTIAARDITVYMRLIQRASGEVSDHARAEIFARPLDLVILDRVQLSIVDHLQIGTPEV